MTDSRIDPETDPLLVDTGRGFFVRYRGRELLSSRDPSRSGERVAASWEPRERCLVLATSPLLGYGLETLRSRLPENSLVVCVELDPALRKACERALSGTVSACGSRVLVLDPVDHAGLENVIDRLGPFRRCEELPLSGGRALMPEAYDALVRSTNLAIAAYWKNRSTLWALGRLWIRNMFANALRFEETRLAPLPDFGGSPTVVCGAGPTLENALEHIRANRGSLRVIACDTALAALARSGIMPDVLVCLESQFHNLKDFLASPGRIPHAVIDTSAHPESARLCGGAITFVCSSFADSRFLLRYRSAFPWIPAIPPLGSVGALALLVALSCSRGEVFACGLDFCHEFGKTHARGTPPMEGLWRSRLSPAVAQWRATFGSGTSRAADGLLETQALASYEETARSLAAMGGSRVADARGLRSRALCPRVVRPDEISHAFLGPANLGRNGFSAQIARLDTPLPEEAGQKARRFVETEAGSIVELGRLFCLLREKPEDGRVGEELVSLVAECDHLFTHFPDPERVKAGTADALARVLAEREYWSAWLDKRGFHASTAKGRG